MSVMRMWYEPPGTPAAPRLVPSAFSPQPRGPKVAAM